MIDGQAQTLSESEIHPTEPNVIGTKLPKSNNPFSIAVRSLKQLQNETRAIEVEFFERVYELETVYQLRHEFVYQKRCDIVNGECIPAKTEGHTFDDGAQSADEKNTQPQMNLPGDGVVSQSGVPHFWLTVLTATLSEIHENDRPILEHLTDVRMKSKPLSDLGFILEFHFSPNEYFQNAVLSKEYFYTSSDNKMIHEIPLIRKSVGCEIKWKEGKAPTYASWFNFLESSKIISNSEEEFMSYITGIQKDFEMGYFIKEHVIPRAVLYYTGEEKNSFNIHNYTTGFWSSPSTISSTEDSVSSEDELVNKSEGDDVDEQKQIAAEDEPKECS